MRFAYSFCTASPDRYFMSAHASLGCLLFLNIMRFEPPTNVKPFPVGPAGIGATPPLLRAAGPQVVSSLRATEPRTHGPPIHTARRPPLNWFSTCVPSRSSWLLSYSPDESRSATNLTPCSAWGDAIVDFLSSAESSAPPASHTNGITWWTR